MQQGLHVAVLGSTGAVGKEIVSLLESRHWPVEKLSLLASARSAGSTMTFAGKPVEILDADKFDASTVNVALLSAGSGPSKSMVPRFLEAGSLVIDNSSAFRMVPEIPLVVPEINIDHVRPNDWLIANPNCCAIILLMAVAPLRGLGNIKRIIVSTYQSASGAGAAAMQELHDQTILAAAGENIVPQVFQHQIAFNLFSHNTTVGEDGYNGEEAKVIEESRKILRQPDLGVNVTCVRVPIPRAHSESITVEFADEAPSVEGVREVLSSFPGVRLVDDRQANHFPMPLEASGQGDVLVGRIRQDLSNPKAISLFACGDQLLKGAALNAVQIGEAVGAQRGIFRVAAAV
ncbi:MAG: aspartate-semialdehyde dehydrogenase [Armatimonadota bacterium]